MAFRQPLNLGAAQSLAYGLAPQPNMQLPPDLAALLAPKQAQEAPPPSVGRGYSVMEALNATPQVQGNSVVEAIGAALQGGLAGREARRERQMQEDEQQRQIDDQTRTRKQGEGRDAAMASALSAYQQADPNDPQAQRNAIIGALSHGAPQEALAAAESDIQRRTPPQPEWQAGYDHAYRINPDGTTTIGGDIPHAPRASSSGGAGGGLADYGLTDQDANDMGSIVALSGMPVAEITGSRDRRINSPIMHAAMETRRRLNLSPGTYAAVRLAYQGDQRSFARLQQQRDSVAANEGAARSALANVATMQHALPRDQISGIPSANDALQAYNQSLGGRGPLAAYVGALVTARAEYARVISGNNSPPVEAMHEAERMLPANITPAQLNDVINNLQREMEFRTQAFDATLEDIQNRVGFSTEQQNGGGQYGPQGNRVRVGNYNRPEGPRTRRYNPQTGRIE